MPLTPGVGVRIQWGNVYNAVSTLPGLEWAHGLQPPFEVTMLALPLRL